jgi:hypothetical protein
LLFALFFFFCWFCVVINHSGIYSITIMNGDDIGGYLI